ncbi:MAG: hypothetical protein ABIN89_04030 [Chitinophagaceae bacterium]
MNIKLVQQLTKAVSKDEDGLFLFRYEGDRTLGKRHHPGLKRSTLRINRITPYNNNGLPYNFY